MMQVSVPPLHIRALEEGRDSVLHAIADILRTPGGKVTGPALSKRSKCPEKHFHDYLLPLETAGYIELKHFHSGALKDCKLTEFGWAAVGGKPFAQRRHRLATTPLEDA